MSAKYKSPSFLLPNELNTSANTANDTGINSLYSMNFDSTDNDYVEITKDDSISLVNTDFSISIWLNPDVSHNGLVLMNYASSKGWGVYYNSGDLKFRAYPSGWQTLTTISTGVWTHILIVGDDTGNNLLCYKNGVEVYNSSYTLSIVASTSNIYVGSQSGSNFFFNGKLDEISIFNRALNTTEIAALYDGTGSNIRPSNLMAANLNPIAYYPLGEQAQNTGYLGNEITNGWQFPNGVLQDYVMDFDSAEAINTSSISDFEFIHNSKVFTISAWFNLDSLSTPVKKTIIQNTYTASAGSGFNLWIDNRSSAKKIRFNLDDQSTSTAIDYTYSSMATGKWVNVIVTGGGPGANNCKMFINGGTEVASATLGSATSVNSSYSAIIGSRVDSDPDSFFNGQLSNIAIWNTDQSANIDNIYNNGSPQTTYTVTPQNWWKLNADSVYTPSAPNYTTALDFDGNSDLINANSVISSISSSATGTVSGWIKYPSTGSTAYMITFTSNTYQTQQQYLTIQKSSDEKATAQLKDRWILKTDNVVFSPGNWYHYAVTQNGTEPKLYINGTEYSSGNGATMTLYTGTNGTEWWPNLSGFNTVTMGGMIWNSLGTVYTNYGDQDLSNISIFNSALTSSQVSTLFNFGTPQTAISFSPQAWWKLDNTTTGIQDSSGNGNNGTNNGATQVNSSVAFTPSWKIPTALAIPSINYTSALKLESSNSESVAFSSSINTSSTTTFSMWLKPTSTNNQYLLSTGSGVNGILIRNSKIYFYDFNAGSGFPQSSDISSTLADGNWHHLAITRDNKSINFYLDGDTINLGTPAFTADFTSFNISDFGKTYNTGQGAYYNGEVSNLAIFNSVLSQPNIQTLYNNGQPQDSISFTPTNWFKLNSINGTTVTDTNGSNNGTTSGSIETNDVKTPDLNIPVNGVSTTLPSTALQQSDLQFDSPYSNYSLSFNGATTYIDCTNYQFSTTKTSISAWFKSSDTRSGEFTEILSKYSDTSSEFQMRLNTGTTKTITVFFLRQTTPNAYITCTTTSTWNDGNWHNAIFTYDSSFASGKLYVDGTLQASDTTNSGTHIQGDANLYIGARQSNSIEKHFLGKIDEVSIWKGTYLSEAQVLEIYNNGKPNNLENFSGTKPSSWWRLGENAYFDNNSFIVPNSISGAPNGIGSGTVTSMLSADAPGTYANGVGTNLDIIDRVGDAALSASNSQSYNMIPSDISPYVPQYVGDQISNTYSMAFDGVGAYFDAGSISALSNVSQYSISLWANIDTSASSTLRFFGNRESSGSLNGIGADIDLSASLYFYLNGGPSFPYVEVSSVSNYITAGTWFHLVCTFNAGQGYVYIDGVQRGSATGSSTADTTTAPLYIGQDPINTNSYFYGLIDEVAIFDTALNAGQIYNDIYQPTATGTNQTADIENNPNLPTPVAWYRMGD